MEKWGVLAAVTVWMACPQVAGAEPAPPPCTAAGSLPADLAAWSMLAYHDAAASTVTLTNAQLTIGETARVNLLHTPAVAYPLRPEKVAMADSYGGLLQLAVPSRGRYRLVLGSRAWIDVVAPNGKGIESSAHGMGPACTGIRKMVDFALAPGRYTVQISGDANPATSVLVIRLP